MTKSQSAPITVRHGNRVPMRKQLEEHMDHYIKLGMEKDSTSTKGWNAFYDWEIECIERMLNALKTDKEACAFLAALLFFTTEKDLIAGIH